MNVFRLGRTASDMFTVGWCIVDDLTVCVTVWKLGFTRITYYISATLSPPYSLFLFVLSYYW